ncbi:MAG: 50S ribosomal protein L21 [Candidatus Limnocylindrales bacterium]
MYAVIEKGGRQYRVELGSEIAVDRMDVSDGAIVEFERVLLVADGDRATIGQPVVAGARVSADVVRQARGEKIVVFKYRPKARSRVKQGARADLTILRISDIVLDGKSAAKAAAAERTEHERLEAAAAAEAAQKAEADKALAEKLAKSTKAAEAAEAKAEATKRAKASAEPAAAGKPEAATKTKAGPAPKPKAEASAKPAKPASARTQAPAPKPDATAAPKTRVKAPAPKKKDE